MKDWTGQRVLIIGAARQGMALARYLVRHGASVVLNDRRIADDLRQSMEALAGLPIDWVMGGHPLELLDNVDLVCVSGGVPLTLPLVVAAQSHGLPVSNDSQIFMEVVPSKVIGITGSAGKTTTTSLVGQMAAIAAKTSAKISRAWVGGNIGNPLISNVDEMNENDLVVMELSSFQLEQMMLSPQIAAVLNITPNHLDRHGTMQAYTAAKNRILEYQNVVDTAVLGRDDPGAWSLLDSVRGELITFGMARPPKGQSGTYLLDGWINLWDRSSTQNLIHQNEINLRGHHNLKNVLAACAIAAAAKIPVEAMRTGISEFHGAPHRLEFVRNWRGVDWYNDSIATAPERAIASIESFDKPLVVLLGGRDKDLPWDELATLVHQRVDHLIIFGEAAGLIESAVQKSKSDTCIKTLAICHGLKDAVQKAADVAAPGSVVLLAPGGTSFDEFEDFAERGECFRKWVAELA